MPRLLCLSMVFVVAASLEARAQLTPANLTVRLQAPVVVRGPIALNELDAPMSMLKLPGSYRAFTANHSTDAIDAANNWQFTAAPTPVILPGPVGSDSADGRWLTSVQSVGGALLGMVHVESAANYLAKQTYKGTHVFTSSDAGLHWTDLGKVIGSGRSQDMTYTGEGDATFIDGHDGYFYAYALRWPEDKTIVARAPLTASPTSWTKYYLGAWSQPGVQPWINVPPSYGAFADVLTASYPGASPVLLLFRSAAYLTTFNQTMLVGSLSTLNGNPSGRSGHMAAFSADHVHFNMMTDPLVAYDGAEDWGRGTLPTTPLILNMSMVDATDATSNISMSFNLWYTYIPFDHAFDTRYLVVQGVSMAQFASPPAFQVGNRLSRWREPATGRRRSTTAPVPGNGTQYLNEAQQGYVMTAPPTTGASLKVIECVYGTDYYLMPDTGASACGVGQRAWPVGWVYTTSQPSTAPLYRCRDSGSTYHFTSLNATCDGLGVQDFLLGYVPTT